MKVSDDVIACDLWFGPPPIKNPCYAYAFFYSNIKALQSTPNMPNVIGVDNHLKWYFFIVLVAFLFLHCDVINAFEDCPCPICLVAQV